MARAYTRYSKSANQTFYYSFTCENCGQANIHKNFTVTGFADRNVPGSGGLSAADEAMMQNDAQVNLGGVIASKKAFVAKGNYGKEINGKCDFCGKNQSWEIKSAKLLPLWRALTGTSIGLLIMIFASFFAKSIGNMAVIALPTGFLLGLIVGIVQLVQIKSSVNKTVQKSLPIIFW